MTPDEIAKYVWDYVGKNTAANEIENISFIREAITKAVEKAYKDGMDHPKAEPIWQKLPTYADYRERDSFEEAVREYARTSVSQERYLGEKKGRLDATLEMAQGMSKIMDETLAIAVKEAIAQERERCAKIVFDHHDPDCMDCNHMQIAAAIREGKS